MPPHWLPLWELRGVLLRNAPGSVPLGLSCGLGLLRKAPSSDASPLVELLLGWAQPLALILHPHAPARFSSPPTQGTSHCFSGRALGSCALVKAGWVTAITRPADLVASCSPVGETGRSAIPGGNPSAWPTAAGESPAHRLVDASCRFIVRLHQEDVPHLLEVVNNSLFSSLAVDGVTVAHGLTHNMTWGHASGSPHQCSIMDRRMLTSWPSASTIRTSQPLKFSSRARWA